MHRTLGSRPKLVIDYTSGSTCTRTVTGNTTGRPNDFTPGCRTASTAPDLAFRVVVPVRSSVTFNSATTTFDGLMHVRSTCDLASSELGCNDDCPSTTTSCVGPLTLGPGNYFVIQDGYSTGFGAFTITVTATRL